MVRPAVDLDERLLLVAFLTGSDDNLGGVVAVEVGNRNPVGVDPPGVDGRAILHVVGAAAMVCQHFTAAGADYKLGPPIVIGIARGDTAHRVVQFAAVAFLGIAGAIEAENNQPPEVVGGWRVGASVNQSIAGHDADFGVVRAIQLSDRDAERGVDIAALERLREAAAAAVEDVEVTVGPLAAVGQPILARIAGRNHDFVIRIIIKVSHLNSHWQLV